MSERLDPLTCRCLEAITLFLSTCHPWHSIQAEWYFKRFLFTRFTGSLHAPLHRDSTTTLTLFTAFWSVLDRPTCESQANILWKLLRLANSVVILWKRAHYIWSRFKTFAEFSDVLYQFLTPPPCEIKASTLHHSGGKQKRKFRLRVVGAVGTNRL